MSEHNWRRQHRVLVTDAHAMGSVAVIRSLGRAGYRVYATSHLPGAIGLRSSFAHRSMVCPPPDAANGTAFKEWLRTTIEKEGISVVVPSESALLSIRDEYDRFRAFLPYSRDEKVVYAGMSKFDLFERFAAETRSNTRIPACLLVRDSERPQSADALAALNPPLFLKADAVHAKTRRDSLVKRCASIAEAQAVLPDLLTRYSKILVQEFAQGVGVGVFLLRWHGRILARFMHRRLHEVPHTGGASSYRTAWWNEAIYQDAATRIEALGWEGVAMFEYRWDPLSGEFRLLELNGRFWGSLHLALFAGIDFPRLLLDAFFGREECCYTFDLKTRSRWTFPREVEYVWSKLKDGNIALSSRLWPLLEFFLLGMNPHIHSDLNFPQDRMLYLHGIRHAIARWTTR